MDYKTIGILFVSLVILSLVVINFSENKKITSIYTHEGFSTEYDRLAGVVHSGDILEIANTNDTKDAKYLNRQDYNSELVFSSPQEKDVNTNLSKLRIISVNHNNKVVQMPIKFNDTIIIAHNAYIENRNQTRFIKYGEKLQSHQQGEMFRTYKIINPSDNTDTSYVKYDSAILLRKADNSDNSFIGIEKDFSISTKNSVDKAAKLYLRLKRVYEPYEKNLCICNDEILYP